MRILIEVSHPARVHLFKNLYFVLKSEGHDVMVVHRVKEQTEELLNSFNIDSRRISTSRSGYILKGLETIKEFVNLIKLGFFFRPNVILSGASPVIGVFGKLVKAKYISFSDTEHASLTWLLSKRLIDVIITPKNFLKDLGAKQIRVESYKELAYLHRDIFKPDHTILQYLGLEEGECFIIIRFISWEALHDKGHLGFTLDEKREAVKKLSRYGKVFISSESALPIDLRPYQLNIPKTKIHDLLFYSTLFFGESGTMATEAALLGTPSVRVSTLAKLLGNFQELQNTYDALYFYDNAKDGLLQCERLLADPDLKIKWRKKRNVIMEDKISLTDFLNKVINSVHE